MQQKVDKNLKNILELIKIVKKNIALPRDKNILNIKRKLEK